jgi:uracil-DNA glycosylase family 4
VLTETAITNAVRCVPPENKPVGAEIATCRAFLAATIDSFPNLSAMVTLGSIAHQSTIRTLGARLAAHPFRHGAASPLNGFTVFSSYHCSRYNTNTGVLTEAMFVEMFAAVRAHLDAQEGVHANAPP